MESAIGHGRQLIKLAARSRVKSLDRQAGGGREQVESGRRRDGVRPVSRAGPAQPASFFRPWGGLRNYDYMRSCGPVNWVRNLTTQGFEKEKKREVRAAFHLFVDDREGEGPKRRPEGGEWEPIKISHGIWPMS
jgi:hypothetical protein